jgi:hypothetical protein
MTTGGDCFESNEIVNILNDTFGKYTAEGGALVASAGTYIAVCAKKFTMPRNGQIMIHKPMAWVDGNETDIENTLKLLKNMTADYCTKYIAKLKKPDSDFLQKWDSGDFWLTAEEAVEWGFADEIKEPQKLDAKTEIIINSILNNEGQKPEGKVCPPVTTEHKQKSDMKQLVTLLVAVLALEGIDENSTEAQVVAAVQGRFNALKSESDKLKTENDKLRSEAKSQFDNAIKAMLDEAQAQGKFIALNGKKTDEIRAAYENVGKTAGIEGLATILGGLQAPTSIMGQINGGKSGASGEIKTFEELLAKGETFLAAFKAEHTDAYKALYKAEFGHEPRGNN